MRIGVLYVLRSRCFGHDSEALYRLILFFQESVAPISDMLRQFADEMNRSYEDSTEADEEVKPNSDDIGKRRRQLRTAKNWPATNRKSS